MTTPEPTRPDADEAPEGGIVRGVAGLIESYGRDTLAQGCVLFSLIVVVGGFVTTDPGWVVVGLLVGLPGMVLPFRSMARRWSGARTWLVCSVILVADLVTLTLMWTIG